MPAKSTLSEFVMKARKIHKLKYDYSLVEYINSKSKVAILCKKHYYLFYQIPNSHLRGRGCPYCGNDIIKFKTRSNTNEFINKSKKLYGSDLFNYNDVNYVKNYIKVSLLCKKCNNCFEISPANHLSGHGCPYCANKKTTKYDFIIKAQAVHGDIFNYDEADYSSTKKKVLIICKKCNYKFYQNAGCHLMGNGCPKCKSSKGERKISLYLDKNNIEYTHQYKIYINNNRRYLDFMFPKYCVAIEYNGQQHYIPAGFGSNDPNRKLYNLKRNWISDKLKQKWCEDNNIELLVIHYWEFNHIEEILDWFFQYINDKDPNYKADWRKW